MPYWCVPPVGVLGISFRCETMRRMAELLPDRVQARRLVVSLAAFWASWAIGVGAAGAGAPAVLGLVVAVGLVFGFRFYLTLYGVWEPGTGESAWRMMFVPSFSRQRQRAMRSAMLALFKPRWIRHTFRETGWNPKLVGFGLLGLLVLDLIIAVVVFSRLPSKWAPRQPDPERADPARLARLLARSRRACSTP